MKRLLALALPLLALAGCEVHTTSCHYHNGEEHCHSAYHHGNTYYHSTPVVTNTYYGEDTTTNIIVVEEEEYYSSCSPEAPYPWEAEWCSFDGITCCAWTQVTNSIEHVYCYYDWCGWELVEINEYY